LAVGVTLVASVALSRPRGALGLGLGISVGLAAQAPMLGFILHRIGEWRPDARLGRRLAAIVGATGVMALGLSGLTTLAGGAAPSSAREALVLAALCASGLILYALAAWLSQCRHPGRSRRPQGAPLSRACLHPAPLP
jgi:peptidoglycan biosynthesis protein MviN/MurJ (putative lipid II flippase)